MKQSMWKSNFFCLLGLSLLCSGCSQHTPQFSYFNMLDSKKNTSYNKKTAEKFWSSIRPVSTLSASYYKLGLYYHQQRKYEKAIEEFSKAIRNDSTNCKAYNGIAISFDALHCCEKAHASYGMAIHCAPDQAYLYNNYAWSSLLCGDHEKGLALLLEAQELSGENSCIKNNLKIAKMLNDRENKSVAQVAQSLPVTPPANMSLQSAVTETEKRLAYHVVEAPSIKLEASLPNLDGAIEVSNGNGVTGMAGQIANYLRGYDFSIRRITNARHFHFNESVILYRKGYLPMAEQLAMAIPGTQEIKLIDSLGRVSIGVRLLLGKDLMNMPFPENYALNTPDSRMQPVLPAIRITSIKTVN